MIVLKAPRDIKNEWGDWNKLLQFTASRLHMKGGWSNNLVSPFWNFIADEGYYGSREGFDWFERLQFWARGDNTRFLVYNKDISAMVLHTPAEVRKYEKEGFWEDDEKHVIPLFPGYAKKLNLNLNQMIQNLMPVENQIKQQEKPKMKSFFDKMLNANKDAALSGVKASAGKAANDFLTAKLYKSLPWTARLFSSKKNAVNNSIFKLVAANLAVAAVEVKGNGNDKLKFISEAMLQDAMLELTRDSTFLENAITQVESVVSLPDGVLDTLKGETK